VTTGELNRMLARVTARHAPKADRGAHAVKLMFGTQVGVAPPTFMFSLSHDVDLHFSVPAGIWRIGFGPEFGFEGTPLVLPHPQPQEALRGVRLRARDRGQACHMAS